MPIRVAATQHRLSKLLPAITTYTFHWGGWRAQVLWYHCFSLTVTNLERGNTLPKTKCPGRYPEIMTIWCSFCSRTTRLSVFTASAVFSSHLVRKKLCVQWGTPWVYNQRYYMTLRNLKVCWINFVGLALDTWWGHDLITQLKGGMWQSKVKGASLAICRHSGSL